MYVGILRLGRQPSWRSIIALNGALLLIIGFGVIGYFQLKGRDASQSGTNDKSVFSSQLVAATNFPLYQPSWLPQGYSIETASITQPQEGVVVFNLTNAAGNKIYISEAARSETYDYGGFFNRIEKNAQFKAKLGQAVVGYVDGEKTVIGSLVSEKTWIIVNGKVGTLTINEAKSILQSFAQ